MKYILTLALLGLVGSATALTNSGTAFDCGPNGMLNPSNDFSYCVARISSVTTVTQLGKQTLNPNYSRIYFVGTNSGTVTGVVTPTVNLYLGNKLVAQQTVSLTTAGNVVNMGTTPYFDGMSVSISTPGLLGTSQSAVISIIQNTR